MLGHIELYRIILSFSQPVVVPYICIPCWWPIFFYRIDIIISHTVGNLLRVHTLHFTTKQVNFSVKNPQWKRNFTIRKHISYFTRTLITLILNNGIGHISDGSSIRMIFFSQTIWLFYPITLLNKHRTEINTCREHKKIFFARLFKKFQP